MKHFAGVVALAVGLTTACTVGDLGTGSNEPNSGYGDGVNPTDPDGETPDGPTSSGIQFSTIAPVSTKLGTTVEIPVTVTPSGLTGAISLSVAGAPADWTVSVTPASIDADLPTEVHILAQIPTNAAVPAGSSQLVGNLMLTGTSGGATATATAAVTLMNQLDLSIASGGLHTFSGLVRVRAGAQLLIKNNDAVNHQVHASAPLAHEGSPLAPGATYTQQPTASGQVGIYCHIHGQGTGTLNIIVE